MTGVAGYFGDKLLDVHLAQPIFFPFFYLATLHAKPAEMDEVVQMKFLSLLDFSSVHPISKILVSPTRN